MGISIERLLDGAVAEVAADRHDGNALVNKERCTAMTQIVDADLLHPCCRGRFCKHTVNVCGGAEGQHLQKRICRLAGRFFATCGILSKDGRRRAADAPFDCCLRSLVL